MPRYCDECQLPRQYCPTDCPAHREREVRVQMDREYAIDSIDWEKFPNYVE